MWKMNLSTWRERGTKKYLSPHSPSIQHSPSSLNYTTHDEFDSADPSSVQDVCHIWTQLNGVLVAQWILHQPCAREVMGSIPVGDSDIFFVPRSRQVDKFIFHEFCSCWHPKQLYHTPCHSPRKHPCNARCNIIRRRTGIPCWETPWE